MFSIVRNPMPLSAAAKSGSVETTRQRVFFFSGNAPCALLCCLLTLWPSYASAQNYESASEVLADIFGDNLPRGQRAQTRHPGYRIVTSGGSYTRINSRNTARGQAATVSSDGRVVIYADTVNVTMGPSESTYDPVPLPSAALESSYASEPDCYEEPSSFSTAASPVFLNEHKSFVSNQCETLARNPIQASRVSSDFGVRQNPFGPGNDFHPGVDFPAKEGTPIPAPAQGVVYDAFTDAAGGKWIELQHNDGALTRFGHLSQFTVRKGESVGVGEIIGYTGNTGLSTGPHLHYEIIPGGSNQIDPQVAALPASLQNCDEQVGRHVYAGVRRKFKNPRAIGGMPSVRRGYFNHAN